MASHIISFGVICNHGLVESSFLIKDAYVSSNKNRRRGPRSCARWIVSTRGQLLQQWIVSTWRLRYSRYLQPFPTISWRGLLHINALKPKIKNDWQLTCSGFGRSVSNTDRLKKRPGNENGVLRPGKVPSAQGTQFAQRLNRKSDTEVTSPFAVGLGATRS